MIAQKKLYDQYRNMLSEKKMAHEVFHTKMREIQEKRRLITSHREGLS